MTTNVADSYYSSVDLLVTKTQILSSLYTNVKSRMHEVKYCFWENLTEREISS
jgi:hypothetical protein